MDTTAEWIISNAIATPTYDLILLIVQVIGVLAVSVTLIVVIRQTRLQNRGLRHSIDAFRLTTRPILHFDYIKFIPGSPKYHLICEAFDYKGCGYAAINIIKNIGKSPLTLKCIISFTRDSIHMGKDNYRSDLLSGKLDDSLITQIWGVTQLPDEWNNFTFQDNNATVKTHFYLIYLAVYKGIDGRLYDTMRIESIALPEFSAEQHGVFTDKDTSNKQRLFFRTTCSPSETYHMYSEEDEIRLERIIKKSHRDDKRYSSHYLDY
jgi:hypothetical protein